VAVVASLSAVVVTLESGKSAALEVTVRNSGTVVDEFTLEVLGAPAPWARLEPPRISLFPGAEGKVALIFSPPRDSSVGAGAQPFAVKVTSREDPLASVVEEGVVEVGVFAEPFAELVPRTARGRGSARYDLAVDNRGNSLLNAELAPSDPDQLLRFECSPPGIAVAPGTASFSRVRVAAHSRFWRGAPKTRPFQVQVRPSSGGPPLVASGTFLQEALLPKWLLKALLALVALAVVLAALWFGLLRPTIHNQAQAAAASAKKAAASAAKSAQQSAANSAAAAKALHAKGVKSSPSPKPVTTPGPATTGTGGTIQVTAAPHHTASSNLVGIPSKAAFELTDVVFENPNGNSGTVSLMRGNVVLLELALQDFRNLDYHFITPLSFPKGTPVTLSVTCANTGSTACQDASYVGGYLQ
jgi:hypothetical protein